MGGSRMNEMTDAREAEHREDLERVRRAKRGDREALEQLLTRHQPWIYNLAVRMLYYPHVAEDATQEIMIKAMSRLASFEERSSFRTWLYRIAVNHALNTQRDERRRLQLEFVKYGAELDAVPDLDLAASSYPEADHQLLVDEARIGCTAGMLLCLDPEQRMTYILGEILGVSDAVGAELMEISPANYRQRLSRARRDLHSFMQRQCGLVNTSNPCRCHRKTVGFIKAGYMNAEKLLFARARIREVQEVVPKMIEGLDELDVAYGRIFREHPFHEPKDAATAIRRLIEDQRFKGIFEDDPG